MVLGSNKANPVDLNCHDWHPGDNYVPLNQSGQQGVEADPLVNGWWAVEVEKAGDYEVALRTRPRGVSHPLAASKARVKLGEAEAESDLEPDVDEVTLTLQLRPGPARLQTWLEADGKSRGAYYVRVRRIEP